MERQLAAVERLLQEQDFETAEEANAFLQQLTAQGGPIIAAPTTPLEEAQELVYQAIEAKGKRREALARQALAISPDCADAYVLLAESTREPDEARRLFEEGMRAGERAMGAEMFEQAVGDFWGLMESRPYMRARAGLADVLWAVGEHDAAIAHLQEMLRLNPLDNQGVRYILASWLAITGADEALERLLLQFPDEMSAFWAYSRLLLTLHLKGPGDTADLALQVAMATNPFVPFFLLGALPLPKQTPEYYGMGDQNEAIAYLEEGGGEAWTQNADTLVWLAEALMRLASPDLLGDDAAAESAHPHRPRKRPRKRT